MSNAVDLRIIQDTIYAWIASRKVVPNQKIILEDQNVDRPKPPYVSYRFLTGPVKIGTRDDQVYDSATDSFLISGPRTISMSIKSYGTEKVSALQLMTNLHGSLELNSVQQLFQSKNMAVHSLTNVLEISSVLETGIEDRAQMDIIFGVTSIQREDQGEISTVNIVGAKIKDVTGADVETINDSVTKP